MARTPARPRQAGEAQRPRPTPRHTSRSSCRCRPAPAAGRRGWGRWGTGGPEWRRRLKDGWGWDGVGGGAARGAGEKSVSRKKSVRPARAHPRAPRPADPSGPHYLPPLLTFAGPGDVGQDGGVGAGPGWRGWVGGPPGWALGKARPAVPPAKRRPKEPCRPCMGGGGCGGSACRVRASDAAGDAAPCGPPPPAAPDIQAIGRASSHVGALGETRGGARRRGRRVGLPGQAVWPGSKKGRLPFSLSALNAARPG